MHTPIHNLAALGTAIRIRRERLGLTQDRLASFANISRATINELENGMTTDLGVSKVMRLLDILGLSLRLAADRNAIYSQAQRGLQIAARTASVSFRNELPPAALAEAVRTGKVPSEFRAHFATLLDEAPIPLVVRAVEQSFATGVPRSAWRHVAKWANEFKSTRNVWR